MLFHTLVLIKVGGSVQPYPWESLMIWEPGRSHYYRHTTRRWDHSWFHCEVAAVRTRIQSTSCS